MIRFHEKIVAIEFSAALSGQVGRSQREIGAAQKSAKPVEYFLVAEMQKLVTSAGVETSRMPSAHWRVRTAHTFLDTD
jgi:hypothetical protein